MTPYKTVSPRQDKPWVGASWKIAAFACYAGINAISRYLSGGAQTSIEDPLPIGVIVFFHDLFALLLLLPWVLKRQIPLIPPNLPIHGIRVLSSAAAIITWYFALLHLPIAHAVALSVIGPLMGALGAKWLLHEKIGWAKGLAILSGFAAACFFSQMKSDLLFQISETHGFLFVLASSSLFAIAKLATRKLAHEGAPPYNLTAYLLIFIVPVTFIFALFNWALPSLVHLPWLALSGLLTALAILCVSHALANAEITFLAPFDFLQFILNGLMGYWIFTEPPEMWAIWLVVAFIAFTLTTQRQKIMSLFHSPTRP